MNERQLLKTLVASVTSAGFQIDSELVTHFYVTVKSKPLIILSGSSGSGKSILVQTFAQVLVNRDLQQFQSMIGHAWWAGQTGNVALLTEAQTRLNTGKFMLLVDEAGRPENSHQVYIACLNKISPAEVSGFFSEVAFQIQNERLMRLPSYHFTQPVPYPRNLIVIGTMDNHWQSGIDNDFRRAGSVIMWQAEPIQESTAAPQPVDFAKAQALFLESRVVDLQVAEAKLASLPIDMELAARSVSQIAGILDEYNDHHLRSTLDRAVIYLANAWSNDGYGLFAERHEENLEMALDNLFAREMVTPELDQMSEPGSRISQLRAALGDRFAQAHRRLDELCDPHLDLGAT